MSTKGATRKPPDKQRIPAQEAFFSGTVGRKARLTSIGGHEIDGAIEGHDHFTISLDGTSPKLVYKHAVAFVSITPEKRRADTARTGPARPGPVIEIKRRRRLHRR